MVARKKRPAAKTAKRPTSAVYSSLSKLSMDITTMTAGPKTRSMSKAAKQATSAKSSSLSKPPMGSELLSSEEAATVAQTQERFAAVATRVFDIPEVLEHILLQLDARSVLKARQTNRTFRNTVNGSTKVKKAIGLLPDQEADFCMPLWCDDATSPRFHGFWSNLDPEFDVVQSAGTEQWEARIMFGIRKGVHSVVSEHLGSACRTLSLCQPPVKSLICQSDLDNSTQLIMDVTKLTKTEITPRGDYITVGDLQDAVRSAVQKHQCPGYEACTLGIMFDATVPLREDDPLIEEAKQAKNNRYEERRRNRPSRRTELERELQELGCEMD